MKILLAVNHPSQYYILKKVSELLIKNNNEVVFCAKDKDILVDLFKADNQKFYLVGKKGKRSNKFSIIFGNLFELFTQDIKLFRIVRDWKPDYMLGTDISISHIGKLLSIPSFIINEDDYEINKLFCNFTYPFASHILTPRICSVGKYSNKKIAYDGYQKLAYLHPDNFIPNNSIRKSYISEENYILLRLVSLTAGHDLEGNHSGLNNETVDLLIEKLSSFGRIFITSESPLAVQYEKYRLKINPIHMHHVLSGAMLLISDSQSMSVEAAMLGIPSLRFSSFIGKISVLEELEHKYGLTFGVSPLEQEYLVEKAIGILNQDQTRYAFMKKRDDMLNDKINTAEFYSWFIQQYPKSISSSFN